MRVLQKMAGPYFPVERVVATRKMKVRVVYTLKLIRIYMAMPWRHVEILVLWEGYTKEESSWVPETSLTAVAKR